MNVYPTFEITITPTIPEIYKRMTLSAIWAATHDVWADRTHRPFSNTNKRAHAATRFMHAQTSDREDFGKRPALMLLKCGILLLSPFSYNNTGCTKVKKENLYS